MKVVISNKAYLKPNEETWEYLRNQTSYHIETPGAKYPKLYQNCGTVSKDIKWIPITRLDLLGNRGINITELVDKRTKVPVEIPKPKFDLREEDQLPIFNECDDTCIINGKPGKY